jgi:hypothetical protein
LLGSTSQDLAIWATAGNGFRVYTNGNNERMRIDSAGNVGIGTSAPTARLETVAARATSRLTSSTGTNAVDFQAVNTGGQLITGIDSSTGGSLFGAGGYTAGLWYTGAYPLAFGTNNTERARISDTGEIAAISAGNFGLRQAVTAGAGTTFGIFVGARSGTAGNTGSGTDTFIVWSNGNVVNTNNSYGAISDAKLKENVTDATPKLEKLNQVRIVNFNMKGETQKQLGVIAQELEQIFPGMIDESPDRDKEGNDLGTTTKSVKYSVFVPMLIKAMQEQQAIIEQLKARLDAANL